VQVVPLPSKPRGGHDLQCRLLSSDVCEPIGTPRDAMQRNACGGLLQRKPRQTQRVNRLFDYFRYAGVAV